MFSESHRDRNVPYLDPLACRAGRTVVRPSGDLADSHRIGTNDHSAIWATNANTGYDVSPTTCVINTQNHRVLGRRRWRPMVMPIAMVTGRDGTEYQESR